MKNKAIGMLFALIVIVLISIVAVSASDLGILVLKIKTGADPGSDIIKTSSHPYCKFSLESTNAQVKAATQALSGVITWSLNGQEVDAIVVGNLQFGNIYFKTDYNGDFAVGNTLGCKLDVTWVDPLDNEHQYKASSSTSAVVQNTNPTLNFGQDTITINEDSPEQVWGTAPWSAAGDADQGQEGLTYSVTYDASKVVCTIDPNGESLTYKPNLNYYNAVATDASCEVTVTDSNSGTAKDKLYFKVNKVSDDAATLSNVPDQKVTVDGTSWTLDMTGYVSNPDNYAIAYTLEPVGTPALPAGFPVVDTNDKFVWTPTAANINVYTVKVTGTFNGIGSPFSDTFKLDVRSPSCIEISDIDVYSGVNADDHESGVDKTGGTAENIQPGDKLKFVVEVKNICEEEDDNDREVENIELTYTMDEMSDEGNDDDDYDVKDLDAGKKADTEITKAVPIDAEEGTYTATFKVIGYDAEDGDKYETDTISVSVDVEKEDDQLTFKTFTLSPSTVSCTKNTQLAVKLMNTGSSNEDDVELVISSSELDIEEIQLLDLDEGDSDDEDTYFSKTYNFVIPSNTPLGSYVVTGKAYYSDDDEDPETVSAVLTLAQCGGSTPSGSSSSQVEEVADKGKEVVEVITTTPQGSTGTQTAAVQADDATGSEESFFDSTAYVVLLVAAIVVVLLVILGLMVAIGRR